MRGLFSGALAVGMVRVYDYRALDGFLCVMECGICSDLVDP